MSYHHRQLAYQYMLDTRRMTRSIYRAWSSEARTELKAAYTLAEMGDATFEYAKMTLVTDPLIKRARRFPVDYPQPHIPAHLL